jgi:type II secretory pathway pseudopilin PulG
MNSGILAVLRGSARLGHDDQRGQTLAGELVALAILGFAVAIILGTITTATAGVKVKNDRVTGANAGRSQSELIIDASYSPDPTAIPYPSIPPVSGYSVDIGVEYWDAATETFITVVQDDGLQKITVTVSKNGDVVFEIESYKVRR